MSEDAVTGGCQCGAVRYTLKGREHTVYACHCRECQKQSASAFALSLPASREDLSIEGELKAYERPAESGAVTRCWFCPVCGTRLYHQSDRAPDRITLKAGTLDDTTGLHPVAHLWTRSKQPWVILDPEVPAFETQPQDLSTWRAGLVSG